ncbi:hypothetical protein PMZ80_002209 [Knufia obscura]|uniref:Uncharacterized protein n=2 Tax=Knufia TaxID=430999 RepID=A0AAN8IHB0_9EURO|nr:hypothetical protein PMZ80_002209 [Knufia obscura]KAK5947887.1 hypothetical protein OHC33_011094 [Knufia fluminis]
MSQTRAVLEELPAEVLSMIFQQSFEPYSLVARIETRPPRRAHLQITGLGSCSPLLICKALLPVARQARIERYTGKLFDDTGLYEGGVAQKDLRMTPLLLERTKVLIRYALDVTKFDDSILSRDFSSLRQVRWRVPYYDLQMIGCSLPQFDRKSPSWDTLACEIEHAMNVGDHGWQAARSRLECPSGVVGGLHFQWRARGWAQGQTLEDARTHGWYFKLDVEVQLRDGIYTIIKAEVVPYEHVAADIPERITVLAPVPRPPEV